MAKWIYDRPGASGRRQGGNPADKAFNPGIGTFVREVLQNSRDARTEKARSEDRAAEVNFEIMTLTGDDAADCLNRLGWDSLKSHLEAAAREDTGLGRNLERIKKEEEVRLLKIEDRNTTGLFGPERGDTDEEAGSFTFLCKDELYSGAKPTESAGGSHGVGKAVLWRFSGLKTVYFNSILAGGYDRCEDSPRLIGRCSLPWHEVDGEPYSGPGWFGTPKTRRRVGKYAASVWGEDAHQLSDNIPLDRPETPSGTTILIADFKEPAEERRSLKKIAEDIRQAAAHSFWPSLLGENPGLWVTVTASRDGKTEYEEQVIPDDFDSVFPFCEASEKYRSGNLDEKLVHPEDTVVEEIEIDLPARRDGKIGAHTAKADLVVRMAEESESQKQYRGSVAYHRGAGMVVKYRTPKRLGLSTKPFHASLVCGLARGDSKSDKAMEYFLRAAEPAEHNRWDSTEDLKESYEQPYKKPLDNLDQKVRTKLSELVSDTDSQQGRRGPMRLSKKFPVGSMGSGNGSSFATMDRFVSRVHDGQLKMEGTVRARKRSPDVWKARLNFHFAHEDSSQREETPLSSFKIKDDEVEARHTDGSNEVMLCVPAGTKKIRFEALVPTEGTVVEPDLISVEGSVTGNEIQD